MNEFLNIFLCCFIEKLDEQQAAKQKTIKSKKDEKVDEKLK